jgi:hypothetical protein
MLDIIKYIVTIAAVTLLTRNLADAHPSNQHSGSECYLRGHRMYVPSGLNYPRQAWANWGISCQAPKPEGIEGTDTAAVGSGERPVEWCGWWMRQHLGGHFGPEYNVARNWLNAGHPLPGPLPGALGIMEHHVFQVVRVIGPDQVLATSGNDRNAVRTRIRSTAKVIGWRDVTDIAITTDADPLKKQQEKGAANDPSAANVLDGLAW